MFRQFGKLSIPAAAAFVTGYYFQGDLKVYAATVVEKSASEASNSHHHAHFPMTPWNKNWDFRDPITLVDRKAYDNADEETQKEMLKAKTPTARRNIILIRHGQYLQKMTDPAEHKLTELGREQAALLGKRLAETGIKFDSLVMSTMPRAMETANIILEKLPNIHSRMDSLLEEGAPYPPEPIHHSWRPRISCFHTEGARIEAAFRKYIHRASVSQKEDSVELIVCHANVIRYFICRALQFPSEGWLRMDLANTSITWLVIPPSGSVSIKTIGDYGHLHPFKITYS